MAKPKFQLFQPLRIGNPVAVVVVGLMALIGTIVVATSFAAVTQPYPTPSASPTVTAAP